MTLLTRRGEGPVFPYAGQPMHILAGQDGQPPGLAAMELAIPAHFAGPIPHVHDAFDEAIYVLSGRLLVAGDDEPQEAHRARCSWRRAGTGTASAIRLQTVPWCWESGRRHNPPWLSCEISAPRSGPTPHPTQADRAAAPRCGVRPQAARRHFDNRRRPRNSSKRLSWRAPAARTSNRVQRVFRVEAADP